MIAADTSTWVAYLGSGAELDTQLLRRALNDKQLLMVPMVLTELLSDPKLPSEIARSLIHVPMIHTTMGYWERAGLLRAKVLAKGCKARLDDALIAQYCIDENVSLLTRDRDFRAFESALGIQFLIDY